MTYIPFSFIRKKFETEGVKNKAYDENVDGYIDRAKLEYPTADVLHVYLAIIDKAYDFKAWGLGNLGRFTRDYFTDKAVDAWLHGEIDDLGGRHIDVDNWYRLQIDDDKVTADFYIDKKVEGVVTQLAVEAVDVNIIWYFCRFSISGSTLKGYRQEEITDFVGLTPNVVATDTDLASGKYGMRFVGHGIGGLSGLSIILREPSSPLPKPKVIAEIPVDKDPTIPKNEVEINTLDGLPDYLYLSAKKYEILKSKGFTDEEIELLFGEIPQHTVDLNAVSWGMFDYKGENTAIIAVYGSNPYNDNAINELIEFVKSKNLKIIKPPQDLSEAIEQRKEIGKDRDMIAGKHNYAYQMIGDPNIEPLAVADFYDGIMEGYYGKDPLRNVPLTEIENTIKMWMDKLERANVLSEEKDKHMRKLKRVLKA